MQGGRAGTLSTAQSRLVVLGRSALMGCRIPSPSDGETPALPGRHTDPSEAPQFVEDEFAGIWGAGNALAKKLQPPPPARAGLDNPAPPRHSWSWRRAGSPSQCLPGPWDAPPGHSCQASALANHPAGHSESPAPSNVSGPKGASASRTGLGRELEGGQAARPPGKSVTLKCVQAAGPERGE